MLLVLGASAQICCAGADGWMRLFVGVQGPGRWPSPLLLLRRWSSEFYKRAGRWQIWCLGQVWLLLATVGPWGATVAAVLCPAGSWRFSGCGLGHDVFVLETRWLRWCCRQEKGRAAYSRGWHGDVLGESLAPILSVPVAVAPRHHLSSWRRLPWSFVYILNGCGSSGEIPSSGFPGGRWRRLRRFLLESIVLESSHPAMRMFLLLSTWQWMSGQRPRVEDL
jgi:hypothetical protein